MLQNSSLNMQPQLLLILLRLPTVLFSNILKVLLKQSLSNVLKKGLNKSPLFDLKCKLIMKAE